MIPLTHDSQPEELIDFLEIALAKKIKLSTSDFDSNDFKPVKLLIKNRLYNLQERKCVYCERTIPDINEIQVDHIKPKSGRSAHPDLCFTYTNYAASCIQNVGKSKRTCGQNKADKILTIEPTDITCNSNYVLNTDGEILPISNSTKSEKHSRQCTLDILGLNKPNLVLLRKKRINTLLAIIKLNPQVAPNFIKSGDFSFILLRLTT